MECESLLSLSNRRACPAEEQIPPQLGKEALSLLAGLVCTDCNPRFL